MAHVAEECRFCTIQFSQSLGTFPFLLVCARVCNAGGDLPRHKADETGITDVERAIWIEAGDEYPSNCSLRLSRDGENESSRGRFLPKPRGEGLKSSLQIL